MQYIVKTLDGKPMAGLFTPIYSLQKARDYARSICFTAQLPDINSVNIFSFDGEEQVLVEVV